EAELEKLRAASVAGEWAPRTEPVLFSLREHARFLDAHAESITAFRGRREAAFEAERQAWSQPVAAGPA
ncbi:MAG: uahA, partial [Solirubrobacterales bacterium]|nr:uahA [Solirubrobacterales bacterium]